MQSGRDANKKGHGQPDVIVTQHVELAFHRVVINDGVVCFDEVALLLA